MSYDSNNYHKFDTNLLNRINPILDVSFNEKTLKYDISWNSLQDLDQNELESEFDQIFYTNNVLRFQDSFGSFHVYRSKNLTKSSIHENPRDLTLKEVLDAMLHFEKMDRIYNGRVDEIFFQSFEKTGPDMFQIVWSS